MEKRLSFKEAKNIFIKRSFILSIIAIIICWFMKLIGFDLFQLDLNNKFFNDMSNFFDNNYWLKQVYYSLTLYLQVLLMTCITQKDKIKNTYKYVLITIPIIIFIRIITSIFENKLGNISIIIEFIITILIISKFKIKKIPRGIFICIISILYQIISLQTRNLNLKAHTYNFVASQILSIDYYILLYLHKEVSIMNDGTLFFFGLTSWIYYVSGFIVGLFTLHPIKKAKEYYAKGKAKEDARKAKKSSK